MARAHPRLGPTLRVQHASLCCARRVEARLWCRVLGDGLERHVLLLQQLAHAHKVEVGGDEKQSLRGSGPV
eukprot:4055645-Pleurochrysis_carterae.AAC.1